MQRFFLILFICFLGESCFSQGYLEFIENKGQWDSRVKFKATLPNGSLYLLNDGYKFILQDTNALQQLNAGITQASKIEKPDYTPQEELVVQSHAYTIQFKTANKQATISAEKKNIPYYNYFLGNDPKKWASHCNSYNAVVYKNIYPFIDVRFYTEGITLKYDYIVHPGGNPANIQMEVIGASDVNLKNGNIVIGTSVGNIKELAPIAYQPNHVKKNISCNYYIKANMFGFNISLYDKTQPLIIDPEIVFSTYIKTKAITVGFSTSIAYSACNDKDGNLYLSSVVDTDSFYISNGAFKKIYGGNKQSPSFFTGYRTFSSCDILVTKLNAAGTDLICATLFGGDKGSEFPHSTVIDKDGNFIVFGKTSSVDLPLTKPVVGSGGIVDLFVAKLSGDCTTLLGSVKMGGSDVDGLNTRYPWLHETASSTPRPASIQRYNGDFSRGFVETDRAGNIYITSCTQSNDFPVTADAIQKTNKGGDYKQDAVYMKFSADLNTLIYSTYLGGTGDDAGYGLTINKTTNDVYLVGVTASNDFTGNTTGTIQPSFNGGIADGFICRFTSNGTVLQNTSYMGTSGIDNIYAVALDKKGYPYITGTTTGSWPLINAPWSQQNGKQFIAKLQPNLSAFVYSTVFGTDSTLPNIVTTAFFLDRCEQVYIAGYGGVGATYASLPNLDKKTVVYYYPNAGTTGLSVTPDAFFSETTIFGGFYFFILSKNSTGQRYGSFFGTVFDLRSSYFSSVSDDTYGGTSRFSNEGVLFQSLTTSHRLLDGYLPTTPNAWGTTQPFYTGDAAAAVKIAFNFAGVSASLQSNIAGVLKTNACLPSTVSFTDTEAKGKMYKWLFGDGTPELTTTAPTANHAYTGSGSYLARLIAVDSTTCNIADTAYLNIRTGIYKTTNSFSSTLVQPCTNRTFNFTNTSTAPAGAPSFTNQSYVWNFGDGATVTTGLGATTHNYANAGNYTVQLILKDTLFCNAPDTITTIITAPGTIQSSFGFSNATGCAPTNIAFTNQSVGTNNSYLWRFGDGTTSTQNNPLHQYALAGTYTVTLITTDTVACNKIDSTSKTLTINSGAKAAFVYNPQPPQANTAVNFINQTTNGSSFKWLFGDGDSLLTSSASAVKHTYVKAGNMNACLIAYNAQGACVPDTSCTTLVALVNPIADVATAFSPNGDGVNDIISVKGYGIAKMQWRIFNRWGNVVFESSDQSKGWDGKYGGKQQDIGVFVYSLEVEFSTGNKFSKNGTITLLR